MTYLGSDLVATLACLDVDDFPHFGENCFDLSARLPGCEWLAEGGWAEEEEEGRGRGGPAHQR